jgi:ribosomal protein S8E
MPFEITPFNAGTIAEHKKKMGGKWPTHQKKKKKKKCPGRESRPGQLGHNELFYC